MLSIYNVGGGEDAGNYYEKADDYYTKDRSPSTWQGTAAEYLGLTGEVKIEDFRQLLDGNLPNGETIQVAAEGRRGGTDLTFSAPKSVSIQALVSGDMRLIDAHDEAVAEALKYAEGLMAYRQTQDGNTTRVFSGNLVAATFRHELSRECDPQLHTHTVVLNATRREDGKWRAMDNEVLYNQKMLMGAIYRASYARKVQKIGYGTRITREDGLFELAHISDEQINYYSSRSQKIEALLAENGLTRETATALEKQVATIATRPQKTDVDREILRGYWMEKAQEVGLEFTPPQSPTAAAAQRFEERFNRFSTSEVVQFAVQHLMERQSVVSESKIVRKALEAGIGRTTHDEIRKEIQRRVRSGNLVQSNYSNSYKDFRLTTPEAIKREQTILSIEKRGRESTIAPMDKQTINPLLNGKELKEGQKQACELILTSTNRVVGVQGLAGTGKTTMLKAARALAEQQGYRMVGVAPSASAAHELADTGMQARTITSFQVSQDKGLDPKAILVIDEAGMASAKQVESLLKSAERYGARVVLLGDTQQLKSVEAGRPFAQLQAHGMAVVGMSEIVRQQNHELKKAVEFAAIGEIRKSVALMEKEVVQIPDNTARYEQIAKDYVSLPEQDRNNTLVVSGTNEARREINERIREGLGLKGRGVEIAVLTKKDLTQAELKRLESYRPGDLIKPDRNYRTLGLQKSELYKVTQIQKSGVTLERPDGSKVDWDPIQKNKVNVYSAEKREMAAGELLRVTQNDREKGIINGDKLKLLEIGEKGLKLEEKSGKIVELSTEKALHLEHGYCSTVHSAQGRTSERVLIEANTKSLTSAQDNFYVAISRAKHEAKIYTNDKEKLPEAMSRKMEKEVALELNRPTENRTFQPKMDLKSGERPVIQQTMKEKTPERRLEFER